MLEIIVLPHAIVIPRSAGDEESLLPPESRAGDDPKMDDPKIKVSVLLITSYNSFATNISMRNTFESS